MLNDQTGLLSEVKTAPSPQTDAPDNSTPTSSYNCDLEGLLTEMQEPREDVNQGKEQVQQPATASYSDPKPAVKEKLTAEEKSLREKRARWEAKFLTKSNDTLQALICSIIAQEDDLDLYRAEKTELEDLANEIYEMRKDAKDHLPPWVGILVGLLLMYGPKYKEAVNDRRVNKALVEKAAREQADKMTALRALQDLRDEMTELKNKNSEPVKTDPVEEKPEEKKEPIKFEEIR